jgi:3-methyladenine DNA glycosylase AlkD
MPVMNRDYVLKKLNALADSSVAQAKAEKFGIPVEKGMLGVYQKEINEIVKELKKNSVLAFELYETGIYEARMVAAKIVKPKEVSFEAAASWVLDFTNWEICDTFSMKVFAHATWAEDAMRTWVLREEEFVKRAAFATLAGHSLANKNASNAYFESYYKMLIQGAKDERLFVKKAVSWALRSIGKRNTDLLWSSIVCAENILLGGSNSEIWVAKDVLKELTARKVRISNYPRSIYGI